MKKHIASILTIILIFTIIGLCTNVSAETTEAETISPISSFVMKKANKNTNIIFEVVEPL